jgi:IS1 family transposase
MIPLLKSLKINNEDDCIKFLLENILTIPQICLYCNSQIYYTDKLFRCVNRNCRKSISIFNHTFFANNHLNCSNTMMIGYFWLCCANYTMIYNMMGGSPNTIVKYIRLFRRLVIGTLDNDDDIIGGNGVIVEMDESKFYSKKDEDGIWVIGGVERTNKKKCFFVVTKQRDAETIKRIVRRHVKRRSVIYTDCWRGYHQLRTLNVRHVKINHGINFVDQQTGAHTNNIEGTWNGLKLVIKQRNRSEELIEEHLREFIWRRKNKNRLWQSFLEALRNTYYI